VTAAEVGRFQSINLFDNEQSTAYT